MGLITVKTFDNTIDAYLLKSKLESKKIICYLFDEHTIGVNPLYNVTIGGIKLKINEEDTEKVKQILSEIEKVPQTNDQNSLIQCPNCESDDLIGNYKSMSGWKGVLSIFTSFFFMVFPVYRKTVCKCNSCNHDFKVDEREVE